jgi:TP901 family phage tail tape measure protein
VSVQISVVGTYDGKDIQRAQRELDALRASSMTMGDKVAAAGEKMVAAGAAMSRAGRTLTRSVTLPVVALGAGAVKAFADFDAAMTESLAIQGPEVAEKYRDTMERTARDVATSLNISHEEAARSFFYLASAGLDAEAQIAAMPAVAAFAKAGMFDMARATDLATDAQSALGLTSDDATENLRNLTRVTDVLVGANTLANASVEQFAEAMTNKAGAALRITGKSIEEGTAVLAAFADQGVKGAEAGEKLNIILRDIPRAAQRNADKFADLGIAVFDADGNLRNMADVVEEFERVLGGMSDAEVAATLETLGLTRGVGDAMKALFGTSGAIRDYESDLLGMGGVTDDVANRQLESFKEQMGLVKSQLVDIGIEVGPMIIEDFLKPLVGFLQQGVEWWKGLDEQQRANIVRMLGVAAAAGPLLKIVGSLVGGLGRLVTMSVTVVRAMATMSGAVVKAMAVIGKALMANPWILVIAAVIALVVVIVKNWDTIKEYVAKAVEWIKAKTTAVWDSIVEATKAFLNTVVEWVKALPGRLLEALKALSTTVANFVRQYHPVFILLRYAQELWPQISGWFSEKLDAIVGWFRGLPGRITSAVAGLWDGIKDSFRSALNWIIDKWNGFRLEAKIPANTFTNLLGIAGKGFTLDTPNIPRLATGGIIPATPGGRLALIGEGGRDEAVVPLPRGWRDGSSLGVTVAPGAVQVTVEVNGGTSGDVEQAVRRAVDRSLDRLVRELAVA